MAIGIRRILEARLTEINAQGGLYGRQLALDVLEIAEGEALREEALRSWLDARTPFALVSPFAPRADLMLQSVASRAGVPVIGAFSPFAPPAFADNRNVFSLHGGVIEQIEALLRHAASKRAEGGAVAIRFRAGEVPEAIVEAAREICARMGLRILDPSVQSAVALRDAGARLVLQLGFAPELRGLLEAADRADWHPLVLWPGSLAGSGVTGMPRAFSERLLVAYPTLPQDRREWALARVSTLLAGRDLSRAQVQPALGAYAATELLAEGLRRAGRRLSRARLTGALETLYEFETGVVPPITFTANRRVGTRGAYILAPAALVQGRLPEQVDWTDLDAG
jgi:ABC-type branched-subunit amino acid transport system substrate-binding protein